LLLKDATLIDSVWRKNSVLKRLQRGHAQWKGSNNENKGQQKQANSKS
jgi:hypothetical protein